MTSANLNSIVQYPGKTMLAGRDHPAIVDSGFQREYVMLLEYYRKSVEVNTVDVVSQFIKAYQSLGEEVEKPVDFLDIRNRTAFEYLITKSREIAKDIYYRLNAEYNAKFEADRKARQEERARAEAERKARQEAADRARVDAELKRAEEEEKKNTPLVTVRNPEERPVIPQTPTCEGPTTNNKKPVVVTSSQRMMMALIITLFTTGLGVWNTYEDTHRFTEFKTASYGPEMNSLKRLEELKLKAEDMKLNMEDFTPLEETNCQDKIQRQFPKLCEMVRAFRSISKQQLADINGNICSAVTQSNCPSSSRSFSIVEHPNSAQVDRIKKDVVHYNCSKDFDPRTASCDVKQLTAKSFGFWDLVQPLEYLFSILPPIGTVMAFGYRYKWNWRTMAIELVMMMVLEAFEYGCILAREWKVIPNGVDLKETFAPVFQYALEQAFARGGN